MNQAPLNKNRQDKFILILNLPDGIKKIVDNLTRNTNRIDANSLREIWMNSKIGEMPAVSLLDELQKKYEVWVISNTTEAHIKSLQSQFVFLNSFNGIITSERAGTHKPNPSIFNFALSEANADPLSSLFIDDSNTNVISAENMGFKVHHYLNFEKFLQFIQAYI